MSTLSFGKKLGRERASRGVAIEEVAETTRIDLRYLRALEADEFDELPGPAFGKFYIRAYAEVLGFDPEPLIEDYDRELRLRAGDSPRASGPSQPARQRPVAAAIARWREERLARYEAADAATGVPGGEEAAAAATGAPGDEEDAAPPPVATASEPDRAPLAVPREILSTPEGTHDEAAALARVFGAHDQARSVVVSRRRWPVVAAVIALVVVATWIVVALTRDAETPDPREADAVPSGAPASEARGPRVDRPDGSTSTPPARPGTDAAPVEPRQADTRVASPGRESAPPPATAAPAPTLRVDESGVGRRVVERRLEGEGARFEEGSSVVYFTRVLGGHPGDRVLHVWLRDGREVQTVALRLGGPHWRTHSQKTLWGAGPWVVEARDVEGHVLSRAGFECVPLPPG